MPHINGNVVRKSEISDAKATGTIRDEKKRLSSRQCCGMTTGCTVSLYSSDGTSNSSPNRYTAPPTAPRTRTVLNAYPPGLRVTGASTHLPPVPANKMWRKLLYSRFETCFGPSTLYNTSQIQIWPV